MSANVRALHRAFVFFTGLSLVLALLAWGVSAHAQAQVLSEIEIGGSQPC